MSNIANQLIAVAATLLGFVAHDTLSNRSAPAPLVASVTETNADPIVTRSIDLDSISADWLNDSPRAERAIQPRPSMPMSEGTVAARLDPYVAEVEFAGVRANGVEQAPDNRVIDVGFPR